MKVRELRKALRGLPADMDVIVGDLSPSDRLVVAVMRYHYAAEPRWSRYTDALFIHWAAIDWKFEIRDGEVVNENSGYRPTLQTVLAEDPLNVRWAITDDSP